MTEAIVAEGLVKKYGDVTALDGIDLEVREGSVMALLGPNGAGKTTAVRIFTTLLIPDGGRAKVAGLDVVEDARALRSKIGALRTFVSAIILVPFTESAARAVDVPRG